MEVGFACSVLASPGCSCHPFRAASPPGAQAAATIAVAASTTPGRPGLRWSSLAGRCGATVAAPFLASAAAAGGRRAWRSERRVAVAVRGAGASAPAKVAQEYLANSSTEERLAIADVVRALAKANAVLARKVATAGIDGVSRGTLGSNASGDTQKPLDVLADELFFEALGRCPSVGVFASEERAEGVALGGGCLCVAIDPLDGSRNIESSLPTGSIFGIFRRGAVEDASVEMRNQAGGAGLLVAGYCLFSSATTLTLAFRGGGVHTWDLSPENAWVVTGTKIRMSPRGQTYSLNDARYFDWPEGLRRYIDTVRQGKGASGKKYSARYVCCLVADFHRTLLTGGWCGNPRPHLRILFENLPLALVAAEAGGAASDGRAAVIDGDNEARRAPLDTLHQRAPLFTGSIEDIEELESYGDLQQGGGEKYTI